MRRHAELEVAKPSATHGLALGYASSDGAGCFGGCHLALPRTPFQTLPGGRFRRWG
jgi:hypothetical protein